MLNFLSHIVGSLGYSGIILLMVLSSAAIPLPSEIVMGFSGFLIGQGKFSLLGVVLAGTVGSFIGSMVLYYVGAYGGRGLVERYGRFVFLNKSDLERTERFFAKYGDFSNFIGRLLPIVRTFISFPAGLAKMRIGRFVFYTLLGSVVWSFLLAYLGEKLGQNWGALSQSFHNINLILGTLIVAGLVFYVYRHLRKTGSRHN